MTTSAEYAEYARLAYFNPEDGEADFTKDKVFLDSDNAEGWIFKFPDKDVISLRGTQPSQWKDVLADLRFWRIDPAGSGEKIHSGVWKQAFSLLPAIIRNTEEEKPVAVTGHSLGGAMAVIVAGFLMKMGYTVTDLYTFGQPRVGNKKFVQRVEAGCNWQRFVNNNDIVPSVPPTFGFMFKDGGDLQYINAAGKCISNSTWTERTKDSVAGRVDAWKQKKFFDSFSDHAIWLYRDHLEDNAKNSERWEDPNGYGY